MDVIDGGLPAPEPQWWVEDAGRRIYRLDLAWPKHRVAVEYDGREFHEGDEREAYDEQRRGWLRRRGWTIIVVTKDDFTADRVDEWINELSTALHLER